MNDFKDNVAIIVAGASGDLAKKKTFPALFALYCHGQLDKGTQIIGYARTKMSDEDYKSRLSSYFKLDTDELKQKAEEFKKQCSYVSGQYDQDDGFQALDAHIKDVADSKANRLFYLALPPSVFGQVAARVRQNAYGDNEARIIIEKPFGHDLESYRALQKELGPQWGENEVYRIDHYMGKEMVKSILPLRENGIFANVWDYKSIESVHIELKEPFGTEGRGGYFDEIGIIRDVMQNHLLQVLSLVAMEPPSAYDPEAIRDEKVKLLEAIKEIDLKDVVLGQYGKSKDGSKPAYTDDETVPAGSTCCTFAAFEVSIDNKRWAGVPFILSAGKALDEGKVAVTIKFKNSTQEKLVIGVQPKEHVTLTLNTRTPGLGSGKTTAQLELPIRDQFPQAQIPEAYEALILDALNGDHANFVRDDELDVSWRLFTPLLHHIDNDKLQLESYAYGSTGPHGFSKFFKANL